MSLATQFNQNSVRRYRDERAPSLSDYANNHRLAGHFNDVTVQVGLESIPANRMVLSCYSKFFETMFLSEFREQYQNRVVIRQDGKAVRTIINYMYAGCIDIDSDSVVNLLATADFLQMDDVKRFCFDFMASAITTDNCIDIFQLSSQYQSSSDLKEMYAQISSKFDQIIESEHFKKLSKNDFLSLLPKLDPQVKESSIYSAIINWVKQDENRQQYFEALFLGLDLTQIPIPFFESVVAKEPLVTQSTNCMTTVMSFTFKNLREANFRETRLNVKDHVREAERILSIGGGWRGTKVVEIYNSSKSTAKLQCPNLPKYVSKHCALAWSGYVYCLGGYGGFPSYPTTNKVLRMNLKERNLKWTEITPMTEKRRSFGAAIFGDDLVVAGGTDNNQSHFNSVELYDIQLCGPKWKSISSMQECRFDFALVAANGSLFAIGGRQISGKIMSFVERLDKKEGSWRFVQPMHTARSNLAAVSCGGFIYAIGGSSDANSFEKTVEKYDPVNDQWSYVRDMSVGRKDHAACVLLGKIFVVGGSVLKASTHLEYYDPAENRWSNLERKKDVMQVQAIVAV